MMTTALPRVRQTPTSNYSPTPIRHLRLFAHMCEGGYAGSVNWLCQRDAKASAHLVMSEDGSEVSQLVPLSMKAWAQCAFNSVGISLEIPGFTAQGIPDARWQAAAVIFGWLTVAYATPPTWAKGDAEPGICQHHDLGAAGGGHVDCTEIGSPTWLRFLVMVQNAHDSFSRGPLPAFLLHGLPNPAQVELPPDAVPTPSHSGLARNHPTDESLHPTSSTYPHGSVADLQWRLNMAGARPTLAVDGWAGPLTRDAIAAFQTRTTAAHPDVKLYVDGLMGPETWRALDTATLAAA